ncbi:tannase/feruloyl esterase family alpha/beta hydrolase [Sphingomonas sp. LT1P40]|uniref:tannase/feruloyl esterase family alpha/beta hydrolase n=1 Tax=Alteristakelama amylovorans TaxID=3096166 RepID=UPI002FC7EBF1
MLRHAIPVLAVATIAGVALFLPGSAAPASVATADLCGVTIKLPADIRVTKAVRVAAGETVAGVPNYRPARPFCRVEGVIEKEIGFELWLPDTAHWNRRFLGAGVGGQAGSIAVRDLARGVERGYAAASTDTGHKASDETWLMNRPDRATNYAERANHLLVVKAKAITASYFGAPARKAIFLGCSGGGRQAMTELQRYPGDYDGIIAGAPGVNTPQMSARRLWEMIQHDRYKGVLDAAGWKRIADAAVAKCDPADGLKDGLIEDPRRCDFRPAELACKPGQSTPNCLSPKQVEVASLIYAPLKDENGKGIDPGLLPGVPISPVAVPEPFTPGPKYLATVLFGQGIYSDANWDVRKFRITRDLPAIDRVMNLHADNPRIDPFVARGGKLILYHGWADALVPAVPTIDYYQALEKRFGPQRTRDFSRLFLIPGMDHCRGGGVPDRFGGAGGLDVEGATRAAGDDLLTAMEQWLDGGPAPTQIRTAQFRDGKPVRTRPVCAFPARVRYVNGPLDRAESYTCQPGGRK